MNNQYTFGKNSIISKEAKINAVYKNSDINKSELGYAFGNSNPDMNSLKFPKKGEDLIKMLKGKRSALQEKLDGIEAQKAAIKTKLVELGIIFRGVDDDGYDRADYDQNTPQEVRELIYQYNDYYACRTLKNEIKTAQALIDNLDDKKTYTLSTPQLISLQKAMEFDIEGGSENDILKAEGSRGGKVIGHTRTGKPIYEDFSHDKHREFNESEHNDAAEAHSKIADKYANHKDQEKRSKSSKSTKEYVKHMSAAEKEKDSAKTRDWYNNHEGETGETKSFKDNYLHSSKEQREHVAEKYFGDKKKDLREVGRHHHEQLSQALYEKAQEDKKGTIEKAEEANDDAAFAKADTDEKKSKVKKVMDEWKAGTLKTSAGKKVTDHAQAVAIAISESENIEKSENNDLQKSFEILGL